MLVSVSLVPDGTVLFFEPVLTVLFWAAGLFGTLLEAGTVAKDRTLLLLPLLSVLPSTLLPTLLVGAFATTSLLLLPLLFLLSLLLSSLPVDPFVLFPDMISGSNSSSISV